MRQKAVFVKNCWYKEQSSTWQLSPPTACLTGVIISIPDRILWRRWLLKFRLSVNRSPAFFWLRRFEAFKAQNFYTVDIRGSYRSVQLVDMKFRKESDGKAEGRDAFLTSAWAALALIEHNDPAAWRTVEREINYLVNFYLNSAGSYDRRRRACNVDYERCFWKPDLTEATREWYIAALAATIVHEATHGRVDSLGFSYNKATRERIERMCVNRQRRFLSRLHSDHYDLTTLRAPFDVKQWDSSWQRGAKFRQVKENLKRVLRDVKQAGK